MEEFTLQLESLVLPSSSLMQTKRAWTGRRSETDNGAYEVRLYWYDKRHTWYVSEYIHMVVRTVYRTTRYEV